MFGRNGIVPFLFYITSLRNHAFLKITIMIKKNEIVAFNLCKLTATILYI